MCLSICLFHFISKSKQLTSVNLTGRNPENETYCMRVELWVLLPLQCENHRKLLSQRALENVLFSYQRVNVALAVTSSMEKSQFARKKRSYYPVVLQADKLLCFQTQVCSGCCQKEVILTEPTPSYVCTTCAGECCEKLW